MAYTLVQYAKDLDDPLVKGVVQTMLRQSDLLSVVPFENHGALEAKGKRWKTLPTAGFRKINDGYSEGGGTTEEISFGLKPMGGDVDFDKIFTDYTSGYVQDPKASQTKMKARAVASVFNEYFILGSPTYDEDGFVGLDYIVDSLPSRQKIVVGSAGTPHDATASDAKTHALLDALHEASDAVGGADAFFCNRAMRLGIASLLRRSGLLTTAKDQFDRTIYEFDGAPIIDVGLQRDQSTEIITDTRDPGDGGNDTTSIFVAKFDMEEGVHGVQLNDLTSYWVGGEGHELEDKPAKRVRIDWVTGLTCFGKYGCAEVYNLKPAGSWT
jgi:hypothetical protein